MSNLPETAIVTVNNRIVDIENPHPEQICIEDIAHALSHLCRYNGHCQRFYSVAEHSYFVSRRVSKEHALWGLLHDAAEAYIGDMPRPFKQVMPGYKAAEERLMFVIAERFGLTWPCPKEVKEVDYRLYATERSSVVAKNDLIPPSDLPEAYTDMHLWCWSPESAREIFLGEYFEIIGYPPNRRRSAKPPA